MKITLDSESINGDNLRTFAAFLEEVSLIDLLVLNKMVKDEISKRVDFMDKRQWTARTSEAI